MVLVFSMIALLSLVSQLSIMTRILVNLLRGVTLQLEVSGSMQISKAIF